MKTQSERMPVVVVSAFGRGQSLVQQLIEQFYTVTYLDATPLLSDRTVVPNPFVCLRSLIEPQSSYQISIAQHQGLVIWLKEGPVEFRGPLGEHHLQAYEFLTEKPYDEVSVFQKTWPWHLMRNIFTKNYFQNYCEQWSDYASLSPFAPFVSEPPFQWTPLEKDLKTLSVECRQLDEWGSLNVTDQKQVQHSSISSPHTFISCLTAEEITDHNPAWADILYKKPVRTARWHWVRYQVKTSADILQSLPDWTVVLDDPYCSWDSDNLFLLKKSSSQVFDLWSRVPTDYLSTDSKSFETLIENQLRMLQIRTAGAPWSVFTGPDLHSHPESGKPFNPYPVFDPTEALSVALSKTQGFFDCSPEFWYAWGQSEQKDYYQQFIKTNLTKEGQGMRT